MTNTILELKATATDLDNQLTTTQYSYNAFKYMLDATDEDIATALQLEANVKELQAQLKAVKATIKIMNKAK